jgi:DNA polymerase
VSTVIWLDYETRSRTDIDAGPHRYCQDPDFGILILAYAIGNRPVSVTQNALEIFEAHEEIWAVPDPIYVAHNSGFDRVVMSTYKGMPVGQYMHPSEWVDPSVLAQCAGYPASLDKLTKALKVSEKDATGKRLINLFAKPNRKGTWNDATTHPEDWKQFCAYAGQDVESMREAARLLPKQSEMERAVWIADQLINDRGVLVDLPMAMAAVRADADNKAEQRQEVIELTGVDNPASVQQLTGWLADAHALNVPNLRKETVTELLAKDDLHGDVRRVLELRQELALISAPGKFKAALAMAGTDGRVRGAARYYGAHTGRWAGRGIQLQNQPRASLGELEPLALLDLMEGFGASSAALKALVRPMLLGPLTVVDYSQIEARVIAWLAGEQWVLDAFKSGRDIYVETARRMHMDDPTGKGRQSGKSAVLGFGYGGGPNAARNVGAKGSDEELEELVRMYRSANPKIRQFWYDLWDAFVQGGEVGPITVRRSNGVRRVRLPSGREIIYRGVVAKRVEKVSEKTGRRYMAWDVISRHPTGKVVYQWHGTIAENVTQAVARDLLAECLPVCEERGIPVVAHIHDEIVAEGDYLEELTKIMLDAPDWADGLPVDADGHVVARYTK